ncbi:four-carbon acid sugar kinase family protein [Limnochorda pilosa]|uniref:four-carbon acid sugar kinase family protein n=1 Tax=Limnochorda pilosa TaxID=1555112 RepID=UPI0026F256D8|nr:four-carbon acid sugar kinase family protein [Limnochorda pilosa]
MTARGFSLGVVADDLTGANATGVGLAALGMEVWSVLDPGAVSELSGPAQALMGVTESRAIPPDEAASRVRAATEGLLAAGATTFGKRIDSTLRGNLGAELEAMLAVLDGAGHPHLALVVPAYPASGRVVAGGYLLVHGVPVQETGAGRDPSAPVRKSQAAQVLAEQTRLPMELVELDRVMQGPEAVRHALHEATRRGRRVVVVDATTDAHIETIARAAVALPQPVLSVDPGPFTTALARVRLEQASLLRELAAEGPEPAATPALGPYLAGAVGSVTDLSLRQVAAAAKAGVIEPISVPLAEWDLAAVPSDESLPQAAARVLEAALTSLRAGRRPVLVTHAPGAPLLPPHAARSVARVVGALVAALARAAAAQGTPLGGLYLSGGDITVATCRALGSAALRLEAQVEPLVALARLDGGPHAGLVLVTKGGLVGDDQALVRAMEALACRVAQASQGYGAPASPSMGATGSLVPPLGWA